MSPAPLFVGADLGGTKISAVLANASGKVVRREYRTTLADGGQRVVVSRLVEAIRQVTGKEAISAVGIAAAGLCTRDGVVTTSPNLPGWKDVPLRDLVQAELDMPTYLGNDANAAALGEHYFGAGRGVRDMAYVTISTGIGGGIIANGQLVTGTSGTAGEVGHMVIDPDGPQCPCGQRGCWEALASGTAIARAAAARLQAGEPSSLRSGASLTPTAADVAAAARAGDRMAQDVLHQASCYLGIGLVNLVHILNPELIVLGGGVSQIGEPLIGPARQYVLEHAFAVPARAVRIVTAGLGQDSGPLGAVALILHERRAEA
ncbi:MAG: ROK family protein [Chloroflexi bacterium]|nr:ROK family protein [Chloroflexota bacterium]